MRKYCYLLLFMALTGCEPGFLDEKPDKRIVVPTELAHFQALLDAVPDGMKTSPGLPVVATDDFYTLPQGLARLPAAQRNTYLWARDVFEGTGTKDWELPYKCIFYANVVLDGLNQIIADSSSRKQHDSIHGSALFFRAFAHYNLVATFAAPYQKETAAATAGIPVRLTSDVNQTVGRGSLQQTYAQILADLQKAETLIEDTSPYTNRPTRVALKALLARIFLSMGDYERALGAADQALALHSKLLDYNTLDAAARRPFPAMFSGQHPEIIFHLSMPGMDFATLTSTGVDSLLYKSYHKDDLRKTCFFADRGSGVFGFKGSYLGSATLFSGLATDELFLIRAECYARSGQPELALKDLNTLLKYRFKSGTFRQVTASADQVLDLVLLERRKELVARGLRWTDLRRLNMDPRLAVTLERKTVGGIIRLSPGDARYTMPIPDTEIALSGIEQNPR